MVARREEIYKSAIDLQYGGAVPEPVVLEVEPLYVADKRKLNVYRIDAGTKEKTLSFNMTVFKAQSNKPLSDKYFKAPFELPELAFDRRGENS